MAGRCVGLPGCNQTFNCLASTWAKVSQAPQKPHNSAGGKLDAWRKPEPSCRPSSIEPDTRHMSVFSAEKHELFVIFLQSKLDELRLMSYNKHVDRNQWVTM